MQRIFRRNEQKYLIDMQRGAVLQAIVSARLELDRAGEYLVQNIYFDTAGWDVIRASIEKPVYKEKLRLRCYGIAHDATDCYLELKRKYKQTVYKRRVSIPYSDYATKPLKVLLGQDSSQIAKELLYYLEANAVEERAYISYRRTAFASSRGSDGDTVDSLRITFDRDLRFRLHDLDLTQPDTGQAILPSSQMLMEVKSPSSMPLWLAGALSELAVYPTAFSKYGRCFNDFIQPLMYQRIYMDEPGFIQADDRKELTYA